jgi:hypothetical protein
MHGSETDNVYMIWVCSKTLGIVYIKGKPQYIPLCLASITHKSEGNGPRLNNARCLLPEEKQPPAAQSP